MPMRSMLVIWMLGACTGAPPEPDTAAPRAALTAALAAEPAAPTGPAGEALRLAADQALAVPIGDPTFDLPLGDALANRLLRPDLGVARLEAADAAKAAPDPWLDALLRLGDGRKFAAAYAARFPERASVDTSHATFVDYASKAARYPDVHWPEAVEAVALAQLVEDGATNARKDVDRPLPDVALAVDVLLALVDPRPARVALGRTAVPADPDPALDRHLLAAADGRKIVAAHANATGFAALHPVSAEIAAAISPRSNTLCVETTIDGARRMFAVEIAMKEQRPWAFVTNDPARASVWIAALDAWTDARSRGETDDVIRPRITETFGPRFRAGS